jgi:thioesterase domain-containing protein
MAALPETRLINGYGPTENTTFTCCGPIRAGLSERLISIPIGAPVANTRVYILDDRRELCGIGVPGEIHIGGDGLALGYRNSPELTAERFVSAPWGERLYRSGDLGRWRKDGTIEFLSRTDSQVKIRGFRIEPGEIEAAITDYPGVEEAFVLPVEDRSGEKRLAAYVKPRAGVQTTEAQIRGYLLDRLPAVLLPSWYCFVDAIPRTANGKRDAAGLPLPESYPRPEARAPHGTTEHRVLEIVRRLLPDVILGADTNLFDAGMHSLLAARLVAQIGRFFGQTLVLSALYANPTVEGIASFIDERSRRKGPDAPVPFFFAHAGHILRHLTARMKDRPFYGIGYSTTGSLPRTIEEHSRNEADNIERIQPRGPILIGGWSASGVLAVEIARELTQRGRHVALVVLFDAPNYSYFRRSPLAWRLTRSLSSAYRIVRYHSAELVRRPAAERVPYLEDLLWTVRRVSRQFIAEAQYKLDPASVEQLDQNRLFIAIARNHVPVPYDGRVLLLRRRERASEWGECWDLGWKGVLSDLEIQTTGGNHMSIFEEAHVDALAELLRQRLEEATQLSKSSITQTI